jgi:tetratricopeptide (TPR) repeat protein
VSDPSSPFEKIFADLVLPEPAGAQPGAASDRPAPEVEPRIREALLLLAEGRYDRSAEVLAGAEALAPADPRVSALAAAHRAVASGRVQPGIQWCLRLLETRPELPDLYAVLGILLRKAKQRAQAHDAFRIGLRLAPAHPGLHSCLAAMGSRREPVLRFLPRSHPANRWCGRVLAWLRVGRHHPSYP